MRARAEPRPSACLHALARAAGSIGEQQEYEHCTQFLKGSSPTAAQTLGQASFRRPVCDPDRPCDVAGHP
ncbi:DUF3151 family protein [Streptomyces sp. NPDC047706]|uniref:DUF3151 family protein n=1 Tax=Streptomyces sp. NPDC047706 TaxID=3365486 RepID=UPI0037167A10